MAPNPAPLPGPGKPVAREAGAPGSRLRGLSSRLAALVPVLLAALLMMPWAPLPVQGAGAGRGSGGAAVPRQSQSALLRQLKDGDAQQRRDALTALADQGDQDAVPAVAAALHDRDLAVRKLAEQALWAIWSRSGNPQVDALFQVGSNLLEQGLDAQAVVVFTRVIRRAPDFAEGYNKRATAYYEMGDYEQSLADIAQVLKRNPYHFGALAGAGLCLVGLGRLSEAIAYFDRALKINPNLDSIRQLRETIAKQIPHPMI